MPKMLPEGADNKASGDFYTSLEAFVFLDIY
jgi:hypothetical protein